MKRKRCKRCGQLFKPKRLPLKHRPWSTHCDVCGVRNLFDALNLPTPPELLDIHTKIPSLSKAEYIKKLQEFNP